MSPLFTIITVTYNANAVLQRTMKSVINQSYAEIEYLIIDGASTDGTVDLINHTMAESSRPIKMISEPDRGLYDAMNKGLKMATGDYVWFLNAGDTLQRADIVEQVAKIAQDQQYPDILYGETDLTNTEGAIIAPRRLKAPETLTWKSFQQGMLICHQAFIVRRLIAPMYDLSYRLSGDYDWCIRCIIQSKRSVNTQLRLVNYLYEGLSTANRKASLKERYVIMCHYYGTFSTRLRHLWFAFRFLVAKVFQNNA